MAHSGKIFICVFFLTGIGQSYALDEDTEAGGACNTPACLQTRENPTEDTSSVIMQMCREALPEHCQSVQPKFTACTPTDEMGWGQITGLSAVSCLTGLWDGLSDTFWFFASAARGLGKMAWASLSSSEYRDEAMNTASFLIENLQASGSGGLKTMFEQGFWNEVDEFMICLNTRGRYEYLCEGASQVLVGGTASLGVLKGLKLASKGVTNPAQKLQWMLRGGRGKFPRLTRRERQAQKESLKNMLQKQDELDVEKLTPFMLSLLTKKQFKNRVDFSKLTDAQAMHLSRRRLSQIPPTEYAKMDYNKLIKTLDRMPDEGFKTLVRRMDSSQLPIPTSSVEKNLHRIPSVVIEQIRNIHKVDPKVFRNSMSSERLKGLDPLQAARIHQGPQYQKLASGQKKIIDDILESSSKVPLLSREEQVSRITRVADMVKREYKKWIKDRADQRNFLDRVDPDFRSQFPEIVRAANIEASHEVGEGLRMRAARVLAREQEEAKKLAYEQEFSAAYKQGQEEMKEVFKIMDAQKTIFHNTPVLRSVEDGVRKIRAIRSVNKKVKAAAKKAVNETAPSKSARRAKNAVKQTGRVGVGKGTADN